MRVPHPQGPEPAYSREEAGLTRAEGRQRQVPVFERWSAAITRAVGRPKAFLIAATVVVAWAVSGPVFGFSDTWQLVINTGTTIVTFLMVFLIQQTQNKDNLAVQLKLNELVAALDGASNRLIHVEGLSEEDLQVLEAHFARLATMAKESAHLRESHSIEEAERRHRRKHGRGARSAPEQERVRRSR
jgi:low affinity Fe/Cu permease